MLINFDGYYADGTRFVYYFGGKVQYFRVDGDVAWEDKWANDWTHFVAYSFNCTNYLFLYKRYHGTVALSKLAFNGESELWRDTWSSDWESFSVDTSGSVPKLISVKKAKTDHDLLYDTGFKTVGSFPAD